MKKITIYVIGLIVVSFLIPIFFTVKFKICEVFSEQKTILDVEKYSYSDFQTIKLLHKATRRNRRKIIRWIYCRSCFCRNTSRLWCWSNKSTGGCSKDIYYLQNNSWIKTWRCRYMWWFYMLPSMDFKRK